MAFRLLGRKNSVGHCAIAVRGHGFDIEDIIDAGREPTLRNAQLRRGPGQIDRELGLWY